MRDLKFRAWDRKKSRMGFPLELTYMFSGDVSSGLMCYALDEKPIRQLNHEFDLMQYTGLKDSKGREVYEGDIVAKFGEDIYLKPIENRYPVCFGVYDNEETYDDWVGGNGWYLGKEMFFRDGKREAGGWESKCRHFIDAQNFEVIGNIYENIGLLKEGK